VNGHLPIVAPPTIETTNSQQTADTLTGESPVKTTNGVGAAGGPALAVDIGLRGAITGLYTLWKTTRPSGASQDPSAFLDLVTQIVL
jgi:hypothetical protein